jgi:hypothetical protein
VPVHAPLVPSGHLCAPTETTASDAKAAAVAAGGRPTSQSRVGWMVSRKARVSVRRARRDMTLASASSGTDAMTKSSRLDVPLVRDREVGSLEGVAVVPVTLGFRLCQHDLGSALSLAH